MKVKLGDVAVLQTGPFGTQFKASEYTSFGIPVINVKNIGYGNIITDELEYISEQTRDRLSSHVLKIGDIVFGRKGSVDRHAFIDERYDGWVQGSDCIRVRCSKDVNSRYVSHQLKLGYIRQQINSSAVGSTMASLNTDILKNIDLNLPDLETQNKVEELLSQLERKIDNNTKICAELESMAKTLYDYWFVQFDFPDADGRPYRTSGGAMVWSDELKREVPEGWGVKRVSDILNISNDSLDPRDMGDTIMEYYSIPAFDDDRYPAFEEAASIESSKYVVYDDSILTSKLNPKFKRLWDPYCLTQYAICSTEFIVYRPNDKSTRPYCYALLNSDAFALHMIQKATSSTGSRTRIQPDVSASLQFALPPKYLVLQFSNLYSPLMDKVKQSHQESRELAALRDWLLPMLMNGQARVE